MKEFTNLGLGKEFVELLKKMGFKKPSDIQIKAIPLVLARKDVIGSSATGSGKTLVFASPIIENLVPNNNLQAMILTPTRELAEQVATSIKEFGENKNLNVVAVYGGVKIEPQIKKLSVADVVVGTPGRIIDHLNRKTLKLGRINLLVLDEVDRMLDMGFSRDVEKIISNCPKKRQTLMFSATISSDIDYLQKKYTTKPFEVSVKSYVDSSKLKQVYYDVPDNKKFSLLVSLLKEENADLVMVFCSTRNNVDFITDNLKAAEIKAKAIHGGIDQKKRTRVLEEFHKKALGVLVCTDVAARGLDIKGVSHVYNYDVPQEAKDYIHRIGRTARAGKEGKAITILASRDYERFGTLMQTKKINITPEKLPKLEFVKISISPKKSNKRFNRNNQRDFRRSSDPRRESSRDIKRNLNKGSRKNRSSRINNKNKFRSRRDPYSKRPNAKGLPKRRDNFRSSIKNRR